MEFQAKPRERSRVERGGLLRGRVRWIIEKFANASRFAPREASAHRNFYDDLYFTEQPYGLVFGFETGLPVSDSSSAALPQLVEAGISAGFPVALPPLAPP